MQENPEAPELGPVSVKRKLEEAHASASEAPKTGDVVESCEKKAKTPPASCHIECRDPTNGHVWFNPVAGLDVAIGERVAFRVVADNGEVLTNQAWTFSNHHVHDYTAINNNAGAVAASTVTATDGNRAQVRLHWTTAGAKTVTLTVDMNGVQGTPTNDGVQVNVVAPNVAVARVIRRVVPRVHNQGGLRYLQLKSNFLVGVTLRFEASLAACGARQTNGRIAGIQLVDCQDYHVADTRQVAWNYAVQLPAVRNSPLGAPQVGQHYMKENLGHTGGAFALDTSAPYGNSLALAGGGGNTRWEANDSPNLPLHPSLTKAFVDSQFRVYFMFKSDQPGSIWVSLMRADWSWGARVERAAAGAQWATNTQIHNPDPAGGVPIQVDGNAYHQHPTWNTVAAAAQIDFVQYTNNPHL